MKEILAFFVLVAGLVGCSGLVYEILLRPHLRWLPAIPAKLHTLSLCGSVGATFGGTILALAVLAT